MSSLTNRTLTLALSETLNFAVQFLSPIFLVRILNVTAYGQYREFIVYSSLILAFLSFSIKSNLLYFIAKDPKNESGYVSNTVFLLLFFSILGLTIVYLLKPYLERITSYDFITLLIIFIFCYQNIDILDTYFVAIKRSDYVLYWSVGNAVLRTTALLLVAYLTRSVISILYLLICLEVIKTSITLTILLKRKILKLKINFDFIKEQLIYIIPAGIAGIILKFNGDISKVIISSNLGAGALAIYAIGSQNIPLLNIVRSSVSNVIFPEMARQTGENPKSALILWNKSNVLYLYLMLPLFILLFFYSKLIITTLFTIKYLPAVPLFRIYLILMIRKCFEMGMPIRALNKNKYFVVGNIISLIVNIVLLYTLYKVLGFVGPAIAAVATEISLAVFLASKILDLYNIRLKELLSWHKLAKIFLASICGIPFLFIGNFLNLNSYIEAVLFSSLYSILYLIIIKKMKIEEVDLFMQKMLKRTLIKWG